MNALRVAAGDYERALGDDGGVRMGGDFGAKRAGTAEAIVGGWGCAAEGVGIEPAP